MGAYVTTDDVLNVRAIALTGIPAESVEVFIAGVEGRVNATLKGRGYSEIPATGENDVAVIREQVVKKIAALIWMDSRSPDNLPEWAESWNVEFETWLRSVQKGESVLLDQDPAASKLPSKRLSMSRLRILPKVK